MSEEISNAVIESARITTGERGFLRCWLTLDYGGARQGFGGYVLYVPKSWAHYKIESVAGHFIFRIMEIAGVTEWDALEGKTVRAKHTHNGISAIGHIVKDDWFCPKEDFASITNNPPHTAEL